MGKTPRSQRPCRIEGCDRITGIAGTAHDLCRLHYGRWQRHGDPLYVMPMAERKPKKQPFCSVDGCDRPYEAHGYCQMHSRRWKAHGTPTPEPITTEQRFWKKVVKTDSCWLWTGSSNKHGHGYIRVNYRLYTAYRWLYEQIHGPLPKGYELHHVCETPACVRPDHLRPVTHRQNILFSQAPTAVNARKTHCPQGHPYDGTNTIYRYHLDGRIKGRWCRTCKRERDRQYRLQKLTEART